MKKNSAPVPWDKSDILNSRTLKGVLLKIMVAIGDFILFSFFFVKTILKNYTNVTT